MTSFIIITAAIIAAMLTFYVNHKLKQGPVRSSALLSLLVALIFYFFPNWIDADLSKNIPVVFIGGSFIGMVSKKIVDSYIKLAISGLVFAIIYLNTSSFFNGYGGALGASAGISLLSVLSLPFFTPKKHHLTNGILQLRKIIFRKNRD
ncbi:hypothetical protein [Pedobacter xixiisoli]|uniref:Uncharacterized protein n=1 Tax=Pedobacter xixiisoli TaxID=1476464 RepID=A0A285ZTV2_9SPHI|nr:hypothetical protein [Pedobacter xixiisoli]SOD13062.1 hypothetical protein SAMN06297358_0988 [Pedobacter xixiisoli]